MSVIHPEIYLRRKQKVYIEKSNYKEVTMAHIGAILKNIEELGYCLSEDVLDCLQTSSLLQVSIFYKSLFHCLNKIVGNHVKHQPMYPNFPEQVMELSEAELYINAMFHYASSGTYFPYSFEEFRETKKNEKKERKEDTIKWIQLGTKEEFLQIFMDLMNANTSISDIDKKDLTWFMRHYDNAIHYLPDEILSKENQAFLLNFVVEELKNCENQKEEEIIYNILKKYIQTATDVLRLAVSRSEGDISLAKPTKFCNFTRRERRVILKLLENCHNLEEDMLRYQMYWIRLGEKLHPGEYKGLIQVNSAFAKIRNKQKINTYYTYLEKAYIDYDLDQILNLLKKRPGEFARKLDYLLRTYQESEKIIEAFQIVADQISTPVLLQVKAHLKGRIENNNKNMTYRVFFPKGNLANVHIKENDLQKIDVRQANQVIEVCEQVLLQRFSTLPPMGKVYLSETYQYFNVPFSQRSASKAMKTIVRGSRIFFDQDKKSIRGFIYWKEEKQRTDIDLSAVVLSENWNYKEHISYTNLKSNRIKSCHSGDITAAPNGASEFIDIDIESALQYGGRYVVFTVLSYTCQKFTDLPECFMGWMERSATASKEIYQPKLVKNKIDLTANTMICIPMIVDLKERCIIWTDLSLKKMPNWNCIENNLSGVIMTCQAMVHCKKPTLYDLISLHVRAHGNVCEEKEEADLIFDLEQGITPYDTEIFMGEYLV